MRLFLVFISIFFIGCKDYDKNIEKPTIFEKGYCATSLDSLPKIYSQIGYDLNKKDIPNIYINDFSKIWKKRKDTEIKKKKILFFKTVLPSILRNNNQILKEREKFLKLYRKFPVLFESEKKYLIELAKKYKALKNENLTKDVMDKLYIRIDIIPVSIALAQAAVESGWGDSRFVHEGNAFFGQWIFSKKGIIPKEVRYDIGDYSIAKFDGLDESIKAYMLNLNSHFFYEDFRKNRAKLRKNGKINGLKLIKYLKMYSEKREEYIKDLKKIIISNRLDKLEDKSLKFFPKIYIKYCKYEAL